MLLFARFYPKFTKSALMTKNILLTVIFSMGINGDAKNVTYFKIVGEN